jgi:general transcription factor 3C polypeptide 3 (transcription factor C subunit 4)
LTANEDIEVADYVDLYREAADALREAGYHSEALQFYEPLRDVMDILDSGFYFDIAICYQALGRVSDVRSAIRSIRQSDRTADAHIGLAKLYQSQGKLDLMWRLIRELRKMGKTDIVRNAGLPTTRPSSLTARDEGPQIPSSLFRRLRKDPNQRKIPKKPIERAKEEHVQDIVVRAMFDDMQPLQLAADASDTEATMEWLSLASELFEVFRSQRAFFPRDKAKPYKGALGNYVSIPDGDILDPDNLEFLLPKEYRKISFDDWADLLMRYAICVADRGNRELCWTIIKVCTDANAIYSDARRHLIVRITALSKFSGRT